MAKTITKPLTLSGRYFSKKELHQVLQTVKSFSMISLTELAQTICEHFSWATPRGVNKINSCLKALKKLDELGYIKLPQKRKQKIRETKIIQWTDKTEQRAIISCALGELGDIELKVINTREEKSLLKEYIDRYHYLGYKHPIGASLSYFIISEKHGIVGCMTYCSSVWALGERERWIGWNKNEREKRLHLIVNNNRFLILPWVKVKNLASKVLSMSSKQIRDDWYKVHVYSPVLIETFVDKSKYRGTCYQTANWICIGNSKGALWKDDSGEVEGTPKAIFMYPLTSNFKAQLRNLKPQNEKLKLDEKFVALWGNVATIIAEVSHQFDNTWQKRKRVIDTMLLIFLIFRLVFSKNSQGYGTTISEFWGNCQQMKFPLPQKKPISASSFSDARKKLDETLFKVLNKKIIEVYEEETPEHSLWNGHRLFAVDGSKINLPRELIKHNYKKPSENSYYPQALVSCLYQLKLKIPFDFDLVAHGNERRCALLHLNALKSHDVVVYDRGYFSYALLYHHVQSGIHPIFRLAKNSCKEIEVFRCSNRIDDIVTIYPSKETQREIEKQYQFLRITPVKLRLIKYTAGGTTFCLGTTLLDQSYTNDDFKDVYHARWGIEELYKVSKQFIIVDDFHGKSDRTVKQELFAHFVLITINRLYSNESENILSKVLNLHDKHGNTDNHKIKVNFKNCLTTVSRHFEKLMFLPAQSIKSAIEEVVYTISRYRQRLRPNRSYPRKSMKPPKKWRPSKEKTKRKLEFELA